MGSDVWIRWLTIISLSVAILSALGAFSWRILRHVSRLADLLPVVAQMNGQLGEIGVQISNTNQQLVRVEDRVVSSNAWHAEHLMREHGMTVRRDNEGS